MINERVERTTHSLRAMQVAVSGGDLQVGIWEPVDGGAGDGPNRDTTPAVLAIHGVTSSHLAWPFIVEQLPGVRVIAPDLRGRGRSNTVQGSAGMRAHADDLVAVLDALGEQEVIVVGHSMGAFVAMVLAHRHPDRVRRLVLIDGGLPLDVPPGLDPEVLIQHILGPVAERLSKRWSSVGEYAESFWRPHPAFADDWSPELEAYIAYDLMPDGDSLRPTTSYRAMQQDTVDLNLGSELVEAFDGVRHPTLLITVPRGLQNEEPGLYAPEYLRALLVRFPHVRHIRLVDLNHYTVVLSARGAAEVGPLLRDQVGIGERGQQVEEAR